jgi:hypothetical protein
VVALAGAVVTAVAVPATAHVQQAHDDALTARMKDTARAVVDPAGLTPVIQGCALRGPGSTRCATSLEDPRAVAAEAHRALTVAAGRPATLTCELMPSSKAPGALPVHWCVARIEDGGHTVTINVDTRIERKAGRPYFAGSNYTVYAN